MENLFIPTENVSLFNDICMELESPASRIGPSLAMVSGQAGRGKSEAAKKYATNSSAAYIPPMNKRSPLMVLREISFELCTIKPGRIESCLDLISDEMGRERRLIMIDEADLLPISILEMLRNVNERCDCPMLLIGEEGLKTKIGSRRRLLSRIRRRMEFGPVSQADIVLFFRKALEVAISPEGSSMIHARSRGDWRPVLTIAIDVERALHASGITHVPDELIKELTGGRKT